MTSQVIRSTQKSQTSAENRAATWRIQQTRYGRYTYTGTYRVRLHLVITDEEELDRYQSLVVQP